MTIARTKIEQARNVNLVEYCDYKGLDLKPEGNDNYRLIGYPGLIIKDNYFNQFGSNQHGNAVGFCVNVLKMDFKYAINELLTFHDGSKGKRNTPHVKAVGASLERKKDMFNLPAINSDNKKVFAYLNKTRGLPADLINNLINDGLLYQDKRNNCVFPCFDQTGQAKGAILRGTLTDKPFRGRAKNSDVDYGWLITLKEPANKVVITEAPIDAMSLIALYSGTSIRSNYILALGGVFIKAVEKFLESYPHVHTIVLAVDNDETARDFINKVKSNLGSNYQIIKFRPQNKKDWNEELLAKKHS